MTVKPPPDWVVPNRTIAVAALRRSGSNLLADLMAQTGRLGRPGEYFNSYVLRSIAPGRGKTIADRCLVAREKGTSENGAVGIKFFPEHFPTPRTGIRFSEWFGAPVWIRLRRRDLLGQAISLVLARQQHAFVSAARPQFEPSFSADEISETIVELSRRDSQWTAYFARLGLDPLDVSYEEVERDPERVLQAIADAAGIDLGDSKTVAPRMFQKQRTALNAEWRLQFLAEMGDPDQFFAPRKRVRGWLGTLLQSPALRRRQ